jgi:serine/threonine protein kinase
MVIDYCPRGDLSDHIRFEKRFSEARSRVYLAEVLLAIEYLHSENVIFRDLKPENVLVDIDGHLKVADFGLAKKLGDKDSSKSFCGSLAYLAPEMMAKKGHSKVLDWYLLGVFLYEMLTGRPPFYSRNKEEMLRNITKAPLTFPSYLSPEAVHLLKLLL